MFKSPGKPRIVVLGLSLELYKRVLPGYMERLEEQLGRFVGELSPHVGIVARRLCYLPEHVVRGLGEAEQAGADAVLLVPVSYTASGMSLAALLKTSLPLVVWNTQEAATLSPAYNFDDLLMNHVTQGTQDLTCTLLRNGRAFGMESGHYRDQAAIERLVEWLQAARAARFARGLRVGLLGHPFDHMYDFAVDEARMVEKWGPLTVRLDLSRFVELAQKADGDDVRISMARDREVFDVGRELPEAMHVQSARLEWAMRRLVEESNLDALTINFMDIIKDGRCETLPFLGINKLMLEGLGYAGEGDIMTAAHYGQMRRLCGMANFTEMFTLDYAENRMLMMHMQECNPAMARRDRPIRLVRKDFWAPGIQPYVGMYFTLEPGPVTLTCMTTNGDGDFFYLAYETRILDCPPLENLDVPHWLVELDEPVGDFLTRYGLAGGMHHLVAAPGHIANLLGKLAHLQGFDFRKL